MSGNRLVDIGDRLYAIQSVNPNEVDNSGFSSVDMGSWSYCRGDEYRSALLLKKYHRQLSSSENELVASIIEDGATVHIQNNALKLHTRVKDFSGYIKLINKYGFYYNGRENVMKYPSKYDRDSFASELKSQFNFNLVGDITDPSKLSTKEQYGERYVEVTVKEGFIYFNCNGFNPTFNEVFSNKSNIITGLMEYMPSDHSRRTPNFNLALEAIKALEVRNFHLERTQFDAAYSEYLKSLDEKQRPIPEVVALLDPAYTLRPFQNEFVRRVIETNGKLLCGDEMGLGKAQPVDTPVLTPEGWRKIGRLKVGDLVIGSNGKPIKVTGVFPQGIKNIYRCYFTDDSYTDCCSEHLWAVNTAGRNYRNKPHVVMSLEEIIKSGLKYKNGNRKHFIPIVKPINFPEKDHVIPPYVLGVLIGDGGLTNGVGFTKSLEDLDIVERVTALLPNFMGISTIPYKNTHKHSLTIKDRKKNYTNPFYDELKSMGLNVKSNKKFIPRDYLFDSIENRLELLRGLMDTDGYVSEDGMNTTFDTSSKELMNCVKFIVQSLGGVVYPSTKIVNDVMYYSLSLCLPEQFVPFHLHRKRSRFKPNLKYKPYRAFDRIRKIGRREAVCISVDSPDRLYVTTNCILTHNTMQSLAYVASQGKKVLVVAPKTVRRNWINEALKFFPSYFEGKVMELSSTTKSGDITPANLYSINYDAFIKIQPIIASLDVDTIIIDESHKIKNPKAKRTQAILQLASKFEHKILLSGTAVINRRDDLKTQINYIDPDFGTLNLAHGALWNKLTSTYYLARTKAEVAKDLPPLVTTLINNNVKCPAFPSDIGDMSKTRVDVALAMVKHTVEFVKDILTGSDSSIIVFSESREAAEAIYSELSKDAILHHGQQSHEKREQAKVDFQNRKKRVFVTTRQSIEVGANLQVADKVIFNDLPWTAADILQAEGRAHRIGSKSQVDSYWMTSQSGWYTKLITILDRKYKLYQALSRGEKVTEEQEKYAKTPINLNDIEYLNK